MLSERPCLKRKKPRAINSGLYLTSAFIHRWVKFTQIYSKSQYYAVNMLPSVAIMLLTCDSIQNVVCD
ncbi:hypothetical protein FCG42_019055 [Escherichia coli]|nr:hypothetical protein [Escherichia coli]EFH9072253.1 hypothetical protein [Escherichia coli]EGO9247415.1 hypothetical protein [Escherichia coli]RRK67984.1 hypothetical protein DU340_07935 [Escherichia coli]TYX72805.1 hypothetical protein FCG42_019055 [Escherichia coli]